MSIKSTEEKIKDVDSLLTTLTKVLKKHWLIISLLALGAFGYLVLTSYDEESTEPETEQVDDTEDDSSQSN